MIKRSFFKLLIVFVLSIVVFEQIYIPMAQADMGTYVQNALSGSVSSVTTGQGGFYHAQGENIYTLGYTRIRFNLTPGNTALFTIQPPQFSMGCSGIDSMWGGFSMISGAELEQILQNIISIAIPFAFNMALGVLCKQCEAIMNQIEAIANKLNGLNFNSCRTAQAAAGALSGMLNSTMGSGSNNSWSSAMNSVLGSTTGSATPTTASGGIEGALASFENSIPSGDCSQASTNNLTGQIQNIYNTISDCGQEKVKRMFHLGSLLRTIADHSNLGITQSGSYGAGTGGINGILGVLRGSLLGDVYAYIPVANVGTKMAKYRMTAVSSGIATASSGSGSITLKGAYKTLLLGGELDTLVISGTAVSDKYSGISRSEFYSSGQMCFPGFENIYINYFQAAYNFMMPGSNFTVPYTEEPTCQPQAVTFSSPAQFDQFISSTQVPTLEVLRLAYAENMPGLVTEAARIAGESALLQWIEPILNGIDLNIYVEQNYLKASAEKTNSVYMNLLKDYQTRVETVYRTLQSKEQAQRKQLNTLITRLKNLNSQWMASLSSAGLLGNYNFSKHLQ
jgi:hypothetical protein